MKRKGKIMIKISTLILAITGVLALGYAVVFTQQYLKIQKTKAENEARFQCAQSSRYEARQDETTTIWYPAEDLYKKCLSEKGLL